MTDTDCPFCGALVDAQLATHGGTCPKCFGHIPGEEAATDPGEDVKTAQAKADARRAQRRSLMPFVIALPGVVIAVVVGAFFLFKPSPELQVLDFDDAEFHMPELDIMLRAEAKPDVNPSASEQASASSQRRRSRSTRSTSDGPNEPKVAKLGLGANSSDQDLLSSLGTSGEGGDSTSRVRINTGTVDSLPDMMVGTQGSEGMATSMDMSSEGMGSQVDMSVKKKVLKDPQAIKQMISRVLRGQLPRLVSCYESRLRSDPNLEGKWELRFTIQTSGEVANAAARGRDMRDSVFEECLVKKLNRWRFSPISTALPVKKTVPFQPR